MNPAAPRRMSIATRFALGVSLLLLLILTVSITGYLSTKLVRDAQTSIQASKDIQRLVLEMDRDVEKARRLHADFRGYAEEAIAGFQATMDELIGGLMAGLPTSASA